MELKINTIERSQNFLSEKYDSVVVCSKGNTEHISRLQTDFVALPEENARLKNDCLTCMESVIDLKCRSMKDNLLFFGTPGGLSSSSNSLNTGNAGVLPTPDVQMDETSSGTNSGNQASGGSAVPSSYTSIAAGSQQANCSEKLLSFCENVLKISRMPNLKFT